MKKSRKNPELATTRSRLDLKRRDFFTLLGGGIAIYLSSRNPSELLALPLIRQREVPKDFNAFLTIYEDGTVICHVGKIEMGQGPITSLPQQVADELDVSIESIKMVMGDTSTCSYDAGTWGSLTTREYSHYLRAACAEARAVLIQLAAEHLNITPSNAKVKEGVVFDANNPEKKISYGWLTKGQRIERTADEKPEVKDHTAFHYVGQSMLHADGRLKVTGEAVYTADVPMPGRVYAKVLRPHSHQVELKSVDYSEAEKIEGVEVVRDGELIAVLHELPDMAERALATIRAEYTTDQKEVDDKTVFDYLLNAPADSSEVASSGNLDEGKLLADHLFESEYYDGYKAHAPIEPHTAMAKWEGDKVTVWASAQSPFGAQDQIARELEMELEDVRVISPFLGGGFGGKIYHPQVMEVVKIAKLAQKPVLLAYTREEEFFKDYFRPAAVVKIRSGVTKNGKITLWDFEQYFAGNRGSDTIYDVPNTLTTGYGEKRGSPVHPFPTGAWRAPANNTNTFARESQIDMMAARVGMDPVEFRLHNLADKKMIAVIEALAEKFGYTPAKGPSGRGIGMACGTDAGTWVAVMIEVKVDQETGEVQPIRAAVSQDLGMCVNPQGIIVQAEGCVTMGMGYALSEDIEFKGGDVISSNFDNYQLPLFSWVPEVIDNVILDRQDQPPQGGGEPAIICMGGALANAIYDACGARLFQMPMTPERVLKGINKA
ncbi:MAG: xanthine dehydrogenase family protein molybdopterin-binding subunit [Bacteroidales bacterium]|nr:xanthine dehydrogenase family protein molybdopterin-binding subunit [Bacteroidales bacterium]